MVGSSFLFALPYRVGGTMNDPAAFINGNDLVGCHVAQNLMLARGLINFD
jgi:hypothetical protein